jgi:NTP pyrophosphatase (non-canonical NTP hydrolase)
MDNNFKVEPWWKGAKLIPRKQKSPEELKQIQANNASEKAGFEKTKDEIDDISRQIRQRRKEKQEMGESTMSYDFLTKAIEQLKSNSTEIAETSQNSLADELDSLTEEHIEVLEAFIAETFNTSELAQKIASIIKWVISSGVMNQLRKEEFELEDVLDEAVAIISEGRGRPKGSTNKPKAATSAPAAKPAAKPAHGDDDEDENEGPAYRSASLGDSSSRRGRGRPTGAVENAHIQDQLKGAIDRGGDKVVFRNGKSHHVKAEHAEAVLRHLHGLKPGDRAETAAKAFDSHDSFQDVLKAAQSKK